MNRIQSWWRQKGFAHPAQILRRLIALPFVQILRVAFVAAVFIGWGTEHAKQVWRDTE